MPPLTIRTLCGWAIILVAGIALVLALLSVTVTIPAWLIYALLLLAGLGLAFG